MNFLYYSFLVICCLFLSGLISLGISLMLEGIFDEADGRGLKEKINNCGYLKIMIKTMVMVPGLNILTACLLVVLGLLAMFYFIWHKLSDAFDF